MDFETYFLSEVHYSLSSPLADVANSIRRNGSCLKGILQSPDYSRSADLKTLNMKLRWGGDSAADCSLVHTVTPLYVLLVVYWDEKC